MECSICCEEINETTGRCILVCKHSFHIICLSRWIVGKRPSQTCPLCRRKISNKAIIWESYMEEPSPPRQRDPLREPTEEQSMMWEAMRLFQPGYFEYEGPNPDLGMRTNWRERRNYYISYRARRSTHTHTDFITHGPTDLRECHSD